MRTKTIDNYVIYSDRESPGSYYVSGGILNDLQKASAIGTTYKTGHCVINGEKFYLGTMAPLIDWGYVYFKDERVLNWLVDAGIVPGDRARLA